jgi:type II secretory pathway component PulF
MKIFDYKYSAKRMRDGKIVKGITEAPSKSLVDKFLQEQGLKPLEIKQHKSLLGELNRVSFGRTIKETDLIFYLRQLTSLLRSGVKVNEASEILATQQTNKAVRRILYGIYYEVNTGTSLADAYKEYPKDFPEILVSMIQIGESTGNLLEAIEEIAEYFEAQIKIKASVRQTLMMPAIYLVVALLVAVFIFVVVMPNFEGMFDSVDGAEMPGVTKAFLNIGNFIKDYAIIIVSSLIVIIGGFITAKKKSKKFQRFLSIVAIKTPIIGTIVRLNNLSRIAATLSQMLNAHVPLQECLVVTYDTLSNQIYKDLIVEAQKNVNAGDFMSKAFEGHYATEVVFTRMIGVGEQTGELGKMLHSLNSFYEEDSTIKIDRVRKALEPILMIFIFSLVLVMILAVMLPSLSFTSQI